MRGWANKHHSAKVQTAMRSAIEAAIQLHVDVAGAHHQLAAHVSSSLLLGETDEGVTRKDRMLRLNRRLTFQPAENPERPA